jgi:hypothetical protein
MSTDYPGAVDTLTNPISTDQLSSPSHADQHANANDAIEAIEASVGLTGTAFPGSPTTDQPFYRTDRHIDYFYDGTRWLSRNLFSYPIPATSAFLPITATNAALQRAAYPAAGLYGVWIERLTATFFVTAGTALSASHKWVGVLIDGATSTTLATVTIDSGASSAWRNSLVVADANIGSTSYEMDMGWTKTGTPGDLYALVAILYRLVG